MVYKKCIFCDSTISGNYEVNSSDIYKCECPNCGTYSITYEALMDLPSSLEKKHKETKHLISGYLREMTELGFTSDLITNERFNALFNNSKIPLTTIHKLDKLLLYIYRKTDFIYKEVVIDLSVKQDAIAYAKNSGELDNMIMALSELGYIKPVVAMDIGERVCVLTIEGLNRAEELKNKSFTSKQAFVAMWFDDSMMNTFYKYISKAVVETGYKPFIIPMKEHNDDICDNIIAEIRNSKFLIADFTGQRGGVYFEAGFAYGLGIPVIWTCHEDWFNKTVYKKVSAKSSGDEMIEVEIEEFRQTHFDINHYNFIVWKNEEDLYEKLKNRILATIPLRN